MSKYTEKEDEIIRENYGKTPVTEWMHLLPERTYDSIMGRAGRIGLKSGLVGNQTTAKFYAKPKYSLKQYDMKDVRELWEVARHVTANINKINTEQNEIDIYLDVDHPILVWFLGDEHIGSLFTDYDYFCEMIDYLCAAPHTYGFSMGDSYDNFLPDRIPSGMFDQVFSPKYQKLMVEEIYGRLKGKWLGVLQGNHEERSYNTDNFEWSEYLANRLDCPNLGLEAKVNLHVGETEYKIALRHKYRYNSGYNPAHTAMQLIRMRFKDADIACVAHHHQAVVQHVAEEDKDRLYLRPGSFKAHDRYSKNVGYAYTGAFIPSVWLNNERREMQGFMHLHRALDYAESVL